MSRRFTPGQHDAIYEARADYRHARLANRRVDVVDIATETANYWWTRLDDRGARIAGRFITWGIPPLSDLQPCRNCGVPFPYDPDADYCPACANEGDIDTLLALAAAGNEQAREMLYDHHGINDEDRAAILAHQTRASIGW